MNARVVIIFACLVLGLGTARADTNREWTATHTAGSSFVPVQMSVDAMGSTYFVGHTDGGLNGDIVLTKFDPSGMTTWQSVYTGPGGQDIAVGVVVTPDGLVVYSVGRAQMPAGGSDFVVSRHDPATGDRLWTRFYNGPGGSTDDPRAAAATPDGGVVVVGGAWNGSQRLDFATVKFDSSGNTVWTRTFADNGRFMFNDDRADDVAVTPQGDVVVTGTARPGIGGSDVVTLKYDGQTGATHWSARYTTNSNESATRVAVAGDGAVVVFGNHPGGIDRSWFVARYDGQSGSEQWVAVHDPGNDEATRSLALDDQGNVYVTGATDPDADDGNFNENLVVMSFAGADGSLRWVSTFGGLGFNEADFGDDLVMLDGSLLVVGSTRTAAFVQRGAEALVLRMEPETGGRVETLTLDFSDFDDMTRDDSFRHVRLAPGGMIAGGVSAGDVGIIPRILLARFRTGCVSDFNTDGAVNSQDFFDFLGAFFATDSRADVNADGSINSQDFFDFLAAFFIGC